MNDVCAPQLHPAKKVYKQKYRQVWEKNPSFKRWLKPIKHRPNKALCSVCNRELAAVVTALRKHGDTTYHKEKVSALVDPTLGRITSMFVDHSMEGNVRDAEIRMAAFISEHNLSFNIMDHFSELLPKLCPDSKIAAQFKSKRTKTKCIVRNALAPCIHEELVEKLKTKHFSVIIDETTDVSTAKELAVVARLYDNDTMQVDCPLYDLVELAQCDAESLFQALLGLLERDGIPISNIIGFAADTTNVMFGEHNSVASRFKERTPEIFLMHCICHSAHLCASHACEKLPRTAEELLRDIYNYFCHSSKRQVEFRAVQCFVGVEPHKLLRPCQTRWLSLHACVSRVIEQWDALVQFFEVAVDQDNLLVSQKILSHLKNPIWKLYFYFLDFVLPKFTELNLMFQSAKTSIHCLHNGLQAIYKEFLSCYMCDAYWRHTPLKNVDPTSSVNFLPLKSMYMGARVTLCLSEREYMERGPDVQHFLKRAQEFFIEAAQQIQKRFPIGDLIVEMLQVLDPDVSHSTFPSLVPLATRFPNLISVDKLQQLDNEWRKLSLVELPFDSQGMDPEVFWARLGKVTDGTGASQFLTLCTFMGALLCLPHANVDVERVFSSVNLIKTKTRNRLHTETVGALLKVKRKVSKTGGCFNFTPPREVKERMSSSVLYHSRSRAVQSDNSDSDN